MLTSLIAGALALVATLPSQETRTPPHLRSGSISNADYPPSAIRAHEQGRVRMVLNISETGRVTECEVAETSGSATLDAASCALAVERFQFEPARDAAGIPMRSTFTQRINWRLPDPPAAAPGPAQGLGFAPFGVVTTAHLRDGQLETCTHESHASAPQPAPPAACSGLLDTALSWAARRNGVVRITHVVTFAPEGAARLFVRPEWGPALVRNEAKLVVAPDGTIADCTVTRDERAPDAEGIGSADPCTIGGRGGGPPFEAAAVPGPRRGHVLIATFAVRAEGRR